MSRAVLNKTLSCSLGFSPIFLLMCVLSMDPEQFGPLPEKSPFQANCQDLFLLREVKLGRASELSSKVAMPFQSQPWPQLSIATWKVPHTPRGGDGFHFP